MHKTTTVVQMDELWPNADAGDGDTAWRLLSYQDSEGIPHFELYSAEYTFEEIEPANYENGPEGSLTIGGFSLCFSGVGFTCIEDAIGEYQLQ